MQKFSATKSIPKILETCRLSSESIWRRNSCEVQNTEGLKGLQKCFSNKRALLVPTNLGKDIYVNVRNL